MQTIGPTQPIELNVVDLRSLPPDERQTESQRILKDESRHRFDLVNGPVMRPTVIRLAADEHILMLNMHHIATDGYSRSAIYRDLTALYEAFANGRPASLHAAAQSSTPTTRCGSADGSSRVWPTRQLEYWQPQARRRALAPRPAHGLPSAPGALLGRGQHERDDRPRHPRGPARDRARRATPPCSSRSWPPSRCCSRRYSGQDDIVIGTPFAGRNRTELESMVGYFINPLALRIDLSGDPTFTELLGRARDDGRSRPSPTPMCPTRASSGRPTRSATSARRPSSRPWWSCTTRLGRRSGRSSSPPGFRCVEITHEKGWSKFDLLLGMSERTTGLNTTWEYSTELFAPSTVARMTEHFRALARERRRQPRPAAVAAVDALRGRAGQGPRVLERAPRAARRARVDQGAVRGAGCSARRTRPRSCSATNG